MPIAGCAKYPNNGRKCGDSKCHDTCRSTSRSLPARGGSRSDLTPSATSGAPGRSVGRPRLARPSLGSRAGPEPDPPTAPAASGVSGAPPVPRVAERGVPVGPAPAADHHRPQPLDSPPPQHAARPGSTGPPLLPPRATMPRSPALPNRTTPPPGTFNGGRHRAAVHLAPDSPCSGAPPTASRQRRTAGRTAKCSSWRPWWLRCSHPQVPVPSRAGT